MSENWKELAPEETAAEIGKMKRGEESVLSPPKRKPGRPRKYPEGYRAHRKKRKQSKPTSPIEVKTQAQNPGRQFKIPGPIDYSIPEQVEQVAICLMENFMDYRAAFRSMYPDAALRTINGYVETARKSPELQKELQQQHEVTGLEGIAKDNYLRLMHSWLYGKDKTLQVVAAKILGRAYVAEKVQFEKPASLKFEGMEEGISRMKLFDDDEADKEENDGSVVPTTVQ